MCQKSDPTFAVSGSNADKGQRSKFLPAFPILVCGFPVAQQKKQTVSALSFPDRPFLRRGGRLRHGVADQDGDVQKVGALDVKPGSRNSLLAWALM